MATGAQPIEASRTTRISRLLILVVLLGAGLGVLGLLQLLLGQPQLALADLQTIASGRGRVRRPTKLWGQAARIPSHWRRSSRS